MRKLKVPQQINGEEIFEEEIIYDIDDFPYGEIADSEIVGWKYKRYLNVPCAFDIEATTISDPHYVRGKTKNNAYGILYQWQFCADKYVIFGRTIQSFLQFLDRLATELNLEGLNACLVIYVHFLPYEWQYIHDFFEWDNIFARKPRQVLKAKTGYFEFRDSYILSNRSLESFCQTSKGCTHYKLVDKYDYRKIRYPWTPLTEEEEQYCYNDARGLCECIKYLMEEDDLLNIPLTSTGYVRRDIRRYMEKDKNNRLLFNKIALSPELYHLCKEAFRGGDVHCSFIYSGEILEGLQSWDLKSSYPAWMMMEKFPMSPFISCCLKNLDFISSRYVWITRIQFYNIKLKKGYYTPYISVSQCKAHDIERYDNGRVIQASFLELAITNLDWEIISTEYDFDKYTTKDTYMAKADYLPKELREGVQDYFYRKCELDGDEERKYDYMKSKNKLNGIFGMMVTDILQSALELDMENYDNKKGGWASKEVDEEKILKHYYSSRKNFLSYQWGIFVTAWARYHLREAIWELKEDHVYNDTDCTKCYPGHEAWFENFNQKITEKAKSMNVPAYWTNPETGEEIVLGRWEHELDYIKFRSWGSKKYVGQFMKKGKMKTEITVAGVSKEGGSTDIARDGIEAFKPGYVFEHSGRTTATYSDKRVHYLHLDGGDVLQASSIAVEDTTYTLGITPEYFSLISKKDIDMDLYSVLI